MSNLTVILAPAGLASGVRDVLHDWSGAGLVERFLWVEPSMIDGSRISALSIGRGGRMTGLTLHSLAGVEQFDRIYLAVLVPAGESSAVHSETAQAVARFLESSFGQTPVVRVRAIILRPGDAATRSDLIVQGWHNVVLSPEDSTGPGVGLSQLQPTLDPVDFGVHAASGLSGLLGLWSGISVSPLDNDQMLPGKVVRLSRSYYRRLGTAHVESRLREQVLSMGNGFPLPTQYGQSSVYIEDVSLATRTMADQLWVRHAAVLRGPRETGARSAVKKIGALEALKMFFGFLFAALRNAPRAWVAGIVHSVKADAASLVHSTVFGAGGSAYQVVVAGVTSGGMTADWKDIGDAAATIDKALEDSGVAAQHEAATDASVLWQDYAAAIMTLADAGERVSGLPPVQIGAQRGVLRRASSAVPSHAESFQGVPPHLAATIGAGTTEPFDVLGRFNLEQRLRSVVDEPVVGVAAATSLHALQQWTSQHADSFAFRVGSRIGDSLYQTANEIKGLLEQIRQAAGAENLLASIQARQKRLARVTQILVIAGLVIIAAIVVAFALGGLEPLAALIAGGSIFVVWVASLLITFMRGQRDLFGLINSRRELLAGEELARRNLKHALRDTRRLSEVYAQFLAWSRVIGTLLGNPFGSSPASASASEVEVGGMPLSVRLGTADVDENVLATASHELRRDVFAVGWLTSSWDAAVSGAHRQIGPRGIELQGQPQAIFRQRGAGEDSLLAVWSETIAAEGVESDVGDELWARILTELETVKLPLAETLLSRVSDARTAGGASIPMELFMGNIDAPERLGVDRFDDGLLTDPARASGRSAVERSTVESSRLGLGRTVCLTQLSAGFAEYELLAFRRAEERSVWSQDDGGDGLFAETPETRTAEAGFVETSLPTAADERGSVSLPSPFDGQSF